MIFNSWIYAIFLAAFFVSYWPLPMRGRTYLIILGGAIFYGWWDPRFLLLMAASTSLDYFAGIGIARPGASARSRRAWLICSLSGNLGILFIFKYANFFLSTATGVLDLAGLPASYRLPEVILPLGISFYTFQSMAYTIDVYRGKAEAIRDPGRFASFVLFFPPMVAGPIERARHLVPQLSTPRSLADVDLETALWRILWGLYKKVLIADNLAKIVAENFDAESKTAGGVVFGAVVFTIQIYCDFSGYSDMAIGSAKLLGIDLVENFRLPFFADSPSDFWSRWHISLSTWLRDYLYIPLGGNRGGTASTYRNLFITMLLGGLWHGASWNFVLWGAYHGAILVAYRLAFGREGRPPVSGIGRVPFVALMFALTAFGFGIFRATRPGQLLECARALTGFDPTIVTGSVRDALFITALVLAMMAGQAMMAGPAITGNAASVRRWPLFPRAVLAFFLIGSLAMFGSTGGVEFIYFQF